MDLDTDQFLDIVHFYRLHLSDPSAHEEINNSWSGRRLDDSAKPAMITEAARKLPVPSWWQGETTSSSATMVLEQMRRKP